MSKKIKIGVLGCADIAKRFLIPAIKSSNSYELIGIASRSISKANIFADEFNTKAFDGYDSLIDIKPDAVYIPLPTGLHYTWVKKALENNIHVLVEKSLACNQSEVLELNTIASDKDLALMENFQFRFHSQLKFLQDKIHDGEIGKIRSIRTYFGFPPFSDNQNIRYQKNIGGGSLLDAGAYTIKISQIILGNDLNVDSAELYIDDDKEVDIFGSGLIKQQNGHITSHISFGFDNFYQNLIEIWGSEGVLRATRIFTAGPSVKPNIFIESNNAINKIELPSDNHFLNMLDHFSKLIFKKDHREIEYDDNINQSRLLTEFYEKSKK